MAGQPWERRRRQGEKQAGPCDLDGSVYNLRSAWWGPPNEYFPSGWRATKHGCGLTETMRRCGCPICFERAEVLERRHVPPPPPPEPEPKRLEVAPVAEHVRRLLAGGMSRTQLAVAAGIDRTTITRLLREDVCRVSVDTAERLLGIAPAA